MMRGESGVEVELRAGVETEYFLLGSQLGYNGW